MRNKRFLLKKVKNVPITFILVDIATIIFKKVSLHGNKKYNKPIIHLFMLIVHCLGSIKNIALSAYISFTKNMHM